MNFDLLARSKNQKKSGFPFSLTISNPLGQKTFYSKNVDEIDNWFDKLKRYCTLRKIEDDYYFLEILGSGATSIVWMIKSKKTRDCFAAKAILDDDPKKSESRQVLNNQFVILN